MYCLTANLLPLLFPHATGGTMPIEVFHLGPLETNCYVVYEGGNAIVLDPGGDPSSVVDFLGKEKLTLAAICITHLHFDHMYGAADLAHISQAPIYIPEADAFLLDIEAGQGGVWGFPQVKRFASSFLPIGEQSFGDITFTALHTPGHTPGSVSLYFPSLKAVFTGDALFYRAVGRSDLPGGDHATLIQSIKREIFALPEDTMVCPGHGPTSHVGDEKLNNPYCSAFV